MHNSRVPTQEDLDNYSPNGDGEVVPRIKPVSIGQLVQDNPTLQEPIIEGLLRRGETANVIGSPKVGKSWSIYDLVLAIAAGREWLGTFQCQRGRCLLIDNELHASNLAHRIKAVAKAYSIEPKEVKHSVDVLSLRGRLMDINRLAIQLEAIERGEYSLIVLDALYRAFPAGMSENDTAGWTQLYNTIDSLAARINCAWVNVHHATKGNQSEKAVVDVGAGSNSQARAADSHIIVRPHEQEGVFVLAASVRSFPPIEPVALRWCFPCWLPDSEVDPSKLKGKASRGEERQAQRDREAFDQILEQLQVKPSSQSELTRATPLSADRLKRLLPMLESRGAITSEPGNIAGNSCRIYRIDSHDEQGVYE